LRMDVEIVLLAGGQSRRMGKEKWLLPLGGEPMLGRLANAFAPLSDALAVVLPWQADEALRERAKAAVGADRPVRWLTDAEPSAGPLAGLEVALADARRPWAFAIACDLPFARPALALALLEAAARAKADAALPRRGGRLHPLFAAYRTEAAAPSLRAYRASGGRKATEWASMLKPVVFEEADVAVYDPDELALFNMNTPEEYERAARYVDGRR